MMNPSEIHIDNYDYPLPQQRIASHPLSQRDSCRLLVYRSLDNTIIDSRFDKIDEFLAVGSKIVFNNTRVINARLQFHKQATAQGDGAAIEIFCLEPQSPRDYAINFASTGTVEWLCFIGNSKKWKDGPLIRELTVNDKRLVLTAVRTERKGNASIVKFEWNDTSVTFSDIIDAAGVIPIPPYLCRESEESDSSDYQTVYSAINGSVAAPTAGLHFTPRLLDSLAKDGHQLLNLTLHVGAGTFQPVKSDTIADHPMHAEFITVERDVIQSLLHTDTPVTAVGTTSVRTLESLYHIGCMIYQGEWKGQLPQWYPYSPSHPHLSPREALSCILNYLDADGLTYLTASTRIIIVPGYDYKIVDAIVTNFHQPRSTLLLLVSAFVGDAWREIYNHALDNGEYRFLSYGDACLLFPNRNVSTI